MAVFLVEANFYDGESSHSQVISIRSDKTIALQDASEYESIQKENKKLAKKDYDYLSVEYDMLGQDACDENLNEKLLTCESILYSDFINVSVSEYEVDKLLYSKEDILYVPTL